jgi:signal transduction histidine kinase
MQLLQSEKLADIGLLAAGVAHEINNPIGFVTSNLLTLDSYARDIVELLDAYVPLEESCAADDVRLSNIRELKRKKGFDFLRDDLSQLISESQEGIERVTRIVNGLKNFSRAESNDWQWTDLHDSLDSILNIVWNEINTTALHKDYGGIPGSMP